jgi:hypothetical protein
MHMAQAVYRELLDSILGYDGSSLYQEVLAPWVDANASERDWLRSFANRRGTPVPGASIEELWRLYALGRINEVLLLRFQQGHADGSAYTGPPISLDEHLAFAEALGLTVAEAPVFSPFYHEIVEVENLRHNDEGSR